MEWPARKIRKLAEGLFAHVVRCLYWSVTAECDLGRIVLGCVANRRLLQQLHFRKTNFKHVTSVPISESTRNFPDMFSTFVDPLKQ
jgi:hypothetical protein